MSSQSGSSSAYRRIAAACLLGSAVLLGGCSKQPDLDNMTTSSTQPASMKDVIALGEKFEADPDNVNLGLAYAAQLKAMGRPQQQFEVYNGLLSKHPSDAKLLNIYGKEMLQSGQAADAATLLERAVKTEERRLADLFGTWFGLRPAWPL